MDSNYIRPLPDCSLIGKKLIDVPKAKDAHCGDDMLEPDFCDVCGWPHFHDQEEEKET